MSVNTMSAAVPLVGARPRTLACLIAVAAAVALPQILHLAGAAAGAGPAWAQSWLPMFLPVMLVGLLAGPTVGLVVGTASPLIAFALTGMPAAATLPQLVVELAVCGVVAGAVAGFVSTRRMKLAVAIAAVLLTIPLVSFIWLAVTSLAAASGLAAAVSAWLAYWVAGLPGFAVQLVAVGVALPLIGRAKRA